MSYPLPNASTDLSGQIAIVTGASSGLGARFARVLAASGAMVALCARRADKLEALKAEIEGAGGKAAVFEVDVSDQAQCMALGEAAGCAAATAAQQNVSVGDVDAQALRQQLRNNGAIVDAP